MRLITAARVRLGLTVSYFIVVFGILFYDSYDNPFCSRPNGPSPAIITARLALACTAWDIFASLCGALADDATSKYADYWPGIAPLVSTLVAGLGFTSIPFWIYQGYGHFLFENTWADVNCFFAEAYGMAFPFVVAPVLAAATLVRELLLLKIQRRRHLLGSE